MGYLLIIMTIIISLRIGDYFLNSLKVILLDDLTGQNSEEISINCRATGTKMHAVILTIAYKTFQDVKYVMISRLQGSISYGQSEAGE